MDFQKPRPRQEWRSKIKLLTLLSNEIQNISKLQGNTGDSASEKKLILVDTKLIGPFRKSSNEIIKQFQIVAKGHNVTYYVINPLKHTISAIDDTDGHVSENGGTWHFAFLPSCRTRLNRLKTIFYCLFCNEFLCDKDVTLKPLKMSWDSTKTWDFPSSCCFVSKKLQETALLNRLPTLILLDDCILASYYDALLESTRWILIIRTSMAIPVSHLLQVLSQFRLIFCLWGITVTILMMLRTVIRFDRFKALK
jgi:hypothetical protein